MATSAGIDIGSEAIKGVVLSRARKNQGPVEVLAAGTLPIGELGHMAESPDKTLALGLKLKELVKGARIRAQTRRMAVSGSATSIRYIQVPPVPPWRLDMLVQYEVDERNSDKEANTYDYRILEVPDVGGQYTVMVGTCKESTANDMMTMGKSAGLGEVEIDLEALALYNAYYNGHGFDSDKTVLIADIGADDLTILLCRNGGLHFARTIMGGGRRFTQVLAEELKIDPLEAEEVKKTNAEIAFDITPSTQRTSRIPRQTSATGIVPRIPGASGTMRPPLGSGSGASGTRIMPPLAGPGGSTILAVPAGAASSSGITQLKEPLQNNETVVGGAGNTPALQSAESLDSQKSDSVIIKDVIATEKQRREETVQFRMMETAKDTPEQDSTLATQAPLAESMLADSLELLPLGTSGSAIGLAVTPGIFDDKRKRQISAALVKEAASLCAALENAVLFSKQQGKLRELKIDRVYVTGGGSKLKGLVEFMSRRMRLEVLPLEPFKQLSLDRLPQEQAMALKAEQHTMAVAIGLALSNLQKGAFSFFLWPEAIIQRSIFWTRGAYLYYAAGLVALTFGLYMYTPFRNSDYLVSNKQIVEEKTSEAVRESSKLMTLVTENDENRQRLEQIRNNTLSGDKFLNILAELKNKHRIDDDIYITHISTKIPNVVIAAGGGDHDRPQPVAGRRGADPNVSAANQNTEPDTFQAQRRVYVRGFARSKQKGDLIAKVEAFKLKLVPHPEDPNHPDNWLFKDIRTIWMMTEDQPVIARDAATADAKDAKEKDTKEKEAKELKQPSFYLKEFVIEAYTEAPKKADIKAAKLARAPLAGDAAEVPAPISRDLPAPVPAMPVPNPAPAAVPATPEAPRKKMFVTPTVQPEIQNPAPAKKE